MTGSEFIEIAEKLERLRSNFERDYGATLRRVEDAATSLARSWSGSNLGYHANIYYENLASVPTGAFFSKMWGTRAFGYMDDETRGEWREYTRESIADTIMKRAGVSQLDNARRASSDLDEYAESAKSDIVSGLTLAVRDNSDAFLSGLLEKARSAKTFDIRSLANVMMPQGQQITRDLRAASGGSQPAPHQWVIADMAAIEQPAALAKELLDIARQAGSHLTRLESRSKKANLVGTNVFIGHGRSQSWRILKDFIRDRAGLPYDEFNRVPVAGMTNITRLNEMLDAAAIAFLVLTAEDEQKDGKMQARMNVIHEVGLFQGRLGFSKAIVILEEGCEEFSNIQGLGQIRFPKGKIEAAFEDVRQVLERESLLNS